MKVSFTKYFLLIVTENVKCKESYGDPLTPDDFQRARDLPASYVDNNYDVPASDILFEGDILNENIQMFGKAATTGKLWKSGKVPYVLSEVRCSNYV